MSLLHREHRDRRRVPFVAISDTPKADAERYRRIFVEVAQHADVVVAAAAAGAISHEEALAVMRRHAQNLAAAVESLASRERVNPDPVETLAARART